MIILGTNSVKAAGGFDVANSLRFNSASTDFLNRTPSSASNRDLWSISVWVKRTKLGVYSTIYGVFTDANNQENFGFLNSDKFQWQLYQSGGVVGQLTTNRLFRDTNAWYHILGVYDSANGTGGNRMRLYINGVEETSFSTDTNPSSGQDSLWNNNTLHMLGSGGTASGGDLFDGYMSEFVAVDGAALSPTDVGEFDEDSGIFKPIKVSGLTFGTNGFYLEYKQSGTGTNASGMGADTSGNTHHFAVNNLTAVDQSTDTCTNNFATMNPLDNFFASATFTEGNTTTAITSSSIETYNLSTIGVSSGKWYAECKVETTSKNTHIGIVSEASKGTGDYVGIDASGYGYAGGTVGVGNKWNNGSQTSYANNYTTNDIIGVAMDLDNNKIYFSKNGTFQNSGDPTSGATGTGAAFTITASSSTPDRVYYFAGGKRSNDTVKLNWNFGSPSFAISSGNQDGNGFGNFEYAVPSGYLSLCTNNLNILE